MMPNALKPDFYWPDTTHLIAPQVDHCLASHAMASDQTRSMAPPVSEALKDSGYYRLATPRELGGMGASLVECCTVQYRLGYCDAGVAIGLNMHLFTVGIMVEHWRRHKDISWMLLEGMARNNSIVASAFAEPGLGGHILRSFTTAKRVKGGYHLDGLKVPCSLARRSDLICLQALTDEERSDNLIVVLLPSRSEGISVQTAAPMLGMGAAESEQLIFKDCFVPDSLVFHRTTPGYDLNDTFAASMVWFCLTASSVYLGLCRRALDEACAILKASKISPSNSARASLPSFQNRIGELFSALCELELACHGLARSLSTDQIVDARALPLALAIKTETITRSPALVQGLIECVGGGAYLDASLLAKLWRDVQAVLFHPPTAMTSRQILGRSALGDKLSFELNDHPIAALPAELRQPSLRIL